MTEQELLKLHRQNLGEQHNDEGSSLSVTGKI